jgi:hypothetical protein
MRCGKPSSVSFGRCFDRDAQATITSLRSNPSLRERKG